MFAAVVAPPSDPPRLGADRFASTGRTRFQFHPASGGLSPATLRSQTPGLPRARRERFAKSVAPSLRRPIVVDPFPFNCSHLPLRQTSR